METLFISILLAALAAALAVYARRLGLLARAHERSLQEIHELSARLVALEEDIAALYAAGVNMDRLLLEQGRRQRECLERIESLRAEEPSSQPYHAAIERLRKGADAQELVSEFGISQSEANLLARLHGTGK
jgi:hypothetical protein